MIINRKYFSNKKEEKKKDKKSIAAGSIAGGLTGAGTLYALGSDEIKDLIKDHKKNNKSIKRMKDDVNKIFKDDMFKIKSISNNLEGRVNHDLIMGNGENYLGKIKTIKNAENQAKKAARKLKKESIKQINQVNRGYRADINKKFLKKLGWKKGAASLAIGTGVGIGVGQLAKCKKDDN